MFYKMIEAKRDIWLQSDECTVKELIAYIEKKGQMRDPQVEAIKTYLFLKIACGAQPLAALFNRGAFNTLNLDEAELSAKVRDTLKSNPAAAAPRSGMIVVSRYRKSWRSRSRQRLNP